MIPDRDYADKSAAPERITRADVLSLQQVADLLQMNPRTIADWARQGRIPSRKRGRVRFYLEWEIRAWLVSRDPETS